MSYVNTVRLMPALLLSVLSFTSTLQAQGPGGPRGGGPPQAMTYEMAAQVADAAEAEARKNKWNMTIVVTDAAGVPVLVRRMTGAFAGSYDFAMRKAATVIATKLTTEAYGEKLRTKEVEAVPNGINFAGGNPLLRGSEFIGAIGVSGARPVDDGVVSLAGAALNQVVLAVTMVRADAVPRAASARTNWHQVVSRRALP